MTTVPTTVEQPRASGLARWASLGGLLYVVLFVIGAILMFGGPEGDDPPAEWVSYYGDSGNRDRIGVGWILCMLGVLCLIWFLARLRDVVARYASSFLSSLVFLGGAVYAATTAVAASLWMGVATMSDDTFRDAVSPDVIHAAGDAAYIIHSGGAVGATSFIVAASLAALYARRVPGWAGWLGVALGIISLFSIAFIPQLALALWLVAASVLLLREPPRAEPVPTAP